MNKLLNAFKKKKLLKICGLRGNGLESYNNIDLVWLNFAPKAIKSGRLINLQTAQKIACGIPPSVIKVWVFFWNSNDEIITCIREVPLDAIQLHDDFDQQYIEFLKQECPSVGIIQAIKSSQIQDISIIQDHVDMLLIDNSHGSGTTLDTQSASNLTCDIPYMIAWWITPYNVWDILQKCPYACGVDIASWVEKEDWNKKYISQDLVKHVSQTLLYYKRVSSSNK